MMKKLLFVLIALVILVLIGFKATIEPQFHIGAGYAAKKMCSCTFIAERTKTSIQN